MTEQSSKELKLKKDVIINFTTPNNFKVIKRK